MRKKVVAIMVLAGILGASTAVSAETTLTEIRTVQNARWIYNTNLLKAETPTGYAVQTVDGTMLTEGIYRDFDCSYGYLIVDENEDGLEYEGVIMQDGTQLIPCDYADIKVLNENWVLAFKLEEATADQYDYESWFSNDTYYKITNVDVYAITDNAAVCVVSLPRENYLDAYAVGEYINIQDRATSVISSYDRSYTQIATDLSYISTNPVEVIDYEIFSENGQKGIKDIEGNVILEPSYQYIYDMRYGYFEVSTGEKEGLLDEAGNVVVPAEYDYVQTTYYGAYNAKYDTSATYCALGYYTVTLNDKVGFVGSDGQLASEPKYSKDVLSSNGVSGIVTDITGDKILVAADGVETILEGYDSIYPIDGGCGMYYLVRNADYMEGMIDWHGEEVFPCIYDDISMSYDGKYLLITEDYSNYVLYEVTTNLVTEGAVAAEETAVVEEATAAEETIVDETVTAENAVVEESVATEETAVADNSGVIAVINSAKSILASDSAENRVAAATIIKTAVTMVGEDQAAVSVILANVVEQLETEGSDVNVILSLIDSAVSIL